MSRTKNLQHKISQTDLRMTLKNWVDANVTRNGKDELIEKLKALKRRLAEIREKGGYVMVTSAGSDITIYKIS